MRALAVADRPAWESWRLLRDDLQQSVSPAHAALFAEPVPDNVHHGLGWWTELDGLTTRYVDCDSATRAALEARLSELLGDVRARGRELRALGDSAHNILADLYDAAIEIPGIEHLYDAGGQPVLAAWGNRVGEHRGGVLDFVTPAELPLTRAERLALAAAESRAWNRTWLTGGVVTLALFLLVIPLALAARSWVAGWLGPSALTCSVPSDDIRLLQQLATARDRERTLRLALEQARVRLTDARGQCQPEPPPVQAVVPPPEEPKPAPKQIVVEPPVPRPSPPPQEAARPPAPEPPQPQAPPAPPPPLPQEMWDKKDLTMLAGCWNRITDMRVFDIDTRRNIGVQSWRMCFDSHGGGNQEVVLDGGADCRGDLRAEFTADGQLRFEDLANIHCNQNRVIYRGVGSCARISETEANCWRRSVNSGSSSNWILRRAQE